MWLPNDLGVLAKINLCNSGEYCTTKVINFSAEGSFLEEIPEADISTEFPVDRTWLLWSDGDWSPDNRLFILAAPGKIERRKILFWTPPRIFDLETMNAGILEIALDEGLEVNKMFWLPNGK